nr:hypothetical protein [Tanacetum cinerariifolium]
MVAILEKSDAAQGFEQIIDFLSGSYIHHALTVNPEVYISCIKQFWNTAVVKRLSDVTRLQALVDKKRIVISEEVVYEILQLNDAEGVPAQDDVVQEHVIEEIATEVLDKCSTLVLRVKGLETANAAQQLEIIKLKARVKKLERLNQVKSSKLRRLKKFGTSQRVESSEDVENMFNQGRISVDIKTDEGVELEVNQEKDAEIEERQEDTEVQEAVEVMITAKLITEVVTAAATQVAAASAPIHAAKPKVLKIAAAPATRRRKGVIIRDPEEELHIDTPAETPTVKDKGKGILIEDPKPMKKKDQIEIDAEYEKKLQEELEKEHEEAYKQIYWNVAFDHVQAKETQGRSEIVQDEDDDVFVEAILLAQKVPIVDYHVVVIDNKPREDLETLWRIIKDRFSTKKPTNFLDEYLLLTLKTMFEELDEQDAI